jgi:hypothetical protein
MACISACDGGAGSIVATVLLACAVWSAAPATAAAPPKPGTVVNPRRPLAASTPSERPSRVPVFVHCASEFRGYDEPVGAR